MGLNDKPVDALTLNLLARRYPRAGLRVVSVEVEHCVEGPSDHLSVEVACARCAQVNRWFELDGVELYAWDRRGANECIVCHVHTVRVPS